MNSLPGTLRRLGWISFFLMWIPFTTLMIAMSRMPDGDYSWLELPLLARASLIVGGLFTAASVLLLVGSPVLSAATNRHVLSSGVEAPATILSITDTGTTINNSPVVLFHLEVKPSGRSAFQAETEKLVPRLQIHRFQPGATVAVMYDPKSLAVAIIDD